MLMYPIPAVFMDVDIVVTQDLVNVLHVALFLDVAVDALDSGSLLDVFK
jgi:hypothetical protein